MPNGRQRPAERVARASLALHGVQFLLLALVATLLAIAGYEHVELVRAVAGVVSVRDTTTAASHREDPTELDAREGPRGDPRTARGVASALHAIARRTDTTNAVAAEGVADGASSAEQFVYRVHGGDSGPMGHSWTPENPMGMANHRAQLGLPKGNSGQVLTRARVKDMGGVVQRDALPLEGNPGGAPEWLFPDPAGQLEVHWTIPLVPPW